jgi:hypothetical protein
MHCEEEVKKCLGLKIKNITFNFPRNCHATTKDPITLVSSFCHKIHAWAAVPVAAVQHGNETCGLARERHQIGKTLLLLSENALGPILNKPLVAAIKKKSPCRTTSWPTQLPSSRFSLVSQKTDRRVITTFLAAAVERTHFCASEKKSEEERRAMSDSICAKSVKKCLSRRHSQALIMMMMTLDV